MNLGAGLLGDRKHPNSSFQQHPSMASKTVIVTGASRGIGLAVAKQLLKDNHKVVLISRSQEAMSELSDKFPSRVAFVAADMTLTDVCFSENMNLRSQY